MNKCVNSTHQRNILYFLFFSQYKYCTQVKQFLGKDSTQKGSSKNSISLFAACKRIRRVRALPVEMHAVIRVRIFLRSARIRGVRAAAHVNIRRWVGYNFEVCRA